MMNGLPLPLLEFERCDNKNWMELNVYGGSEYFRKLEHDLIKNGYITTDDQREEEIEETE